MRTDPARLRCPVYDLEPEMPRKLTLVEEFTASRDVESLLCWWWWFGFLVGAGAGFAAAILLLSYLEQVAL